MWVSVEELRTINVIFKLNLPLYTKHKWTSPHDQQWLMKISQLGSACLNVLCDIVLCGRLRYITVQFLWILFYAFPTLIFDPHYRTARKMCNIIFVSYNLVNFVSLVHTMCTRYTITVMLLNRELIHIKNMQFGGQTNTDETKQNNFAMIDNAISS